MAFMCSFLSLTIYRCLIKITESEFSRRKTEEKIEKMLLFCFFRCFLQKPEKENSDIESLWAGYLSVIV